MRLTEIGAVVAIGKEPRRLAGPERHGAAAVQFRCTAHDRAASLARSSTNPAREALHRGGMEVAWVWHGWLGYWQLQAGFIGHGTDKAAHHPATPLRLATGSVSVVTENEASGSRIVE